MVEVCLDGTLHINVLQLMPAPNSIVPHSHVLTSPCGVLTASAMAGYHCTLHIIVFNALEASVSTRMNLLSLKLHDSHLSYFCYLPPAGLLPL